MATLIGEATPEPQSGTAASLADVQRMVGEMAAMLERMKEPALVPSAPVEAPRTRSFAPPKKAPAPIIEASHPRAWLARKILRLRHRRATHFGSLELFPDPAWDVLLDLYAARLDQKHVSVSSACLAAMVPPTTALRWLTTLQNEGLIATADDPDDRRRRWVDLTDAGVAAIDAFVDDFYVLMSEVAAPRIHKLP